MAYPGHHGDAKHHGGKDVEEHLIENAVWQRMLAALGMVSQSAPFAARHAQQRGDNPDAKSGNCPRDQLVSVKRTLTDTLKSVRQP